LFASAGGGDSVLLTVLGASVVVLSLFPKESVVVIPAANAKSSIGLFSSAGDEDSVLLLVLGGSVVVLLLLNAVGTVAVGTVAVEADSIGPDAVGPILVVSLLGTCSNLCPANDVISWMRPSGDEGSKVPRSSRFVNNLWKLNLLEGLTVVLFWPSLGPEFGFMSAIYLLENKHPHTD
jgi:hypothetical protein